MNFNLKRVLEFSTNPYEDYKKIFFSKICNIFTRYRILTLWISLHIKTEMKIIHENLKTFTLQDPHL